MLGHVVVVTDSLSVDGGSAAVALGSAHALAGRGLGVTLFTAGGEAPSDSARLSNLRVVNTGQGNALASQNRFAGALRGLWNRSAAVEMSALLATLDPKETVVHVHGWTKALSSSVLRRIAVAGFPVVVTLHDYFSACPTGCLYNHREQQLCTRTPMSLDCITTNCDSRSFAFKMYRVVRQFVQRGAGMFPRRTGTYITVSDFSRRVIEPMLPANSRFFAVDNPIDAERGSRVVAESNRPFVFVGRLSAEKGGTLLAEAARRANVPVVFVGDGPDAAEILRINPNARVTGWLERDGVSAELRGARCVVMPSLWYETMGLAVLEAAAAGVPAIVPAGTAPSELIVAGRTGLSFSRGDVDDLAAQLRACAADDHLVARLSRGAFAAYWSRPQTMRLHVDRLLSAYHAVLESEPLELIAERSA